jgi:hypothetical protein
MLTERDEDRRRLVAVESGEGGMGVLLRLVPDGGNYRSEPFGNSPERWRKIVLAVRPDDEDRPNGPVRPHAAYGKWGFSG